MSTQTYHYTGYDRNGARTKGDASAVSERELRRQLRSRGILVTELRCATRASAISRRRTRLGAVDTSLMMRQLATLQKSGLPLDESLGLLAQQCEAGKQRHAAEQWREGLREGLSLAQSMERAYIRVSDGLVAAIAVAEETGHLHKVLQRLADELDVTADNRQTLLKGLIYPAVMVVVAVAVSTVLLAYVVPQVSKVFLSNRIELPLLTRAMISISGALRDYGLTMLGLLGASGCAVAMRLRDAASRRAFHRLLLRAPLFGKWLRMAEFADWSRSLGMLLGGGVPILPALRIASGSLRNDHLRMQLEQVIEDVRKGNGLHGALRCCPEVPPFLLHMVASGEESSELDVMLLRVADYYSRSLQSSVQTALKLMEPALVVMMAGFVMLIVGAVLVPIVRMNQLF